jgi:hypothetical protein
MNMKIDEKTLRRIIREELTGTPSHHAYERLATSLDEAVDAASDLLDIVDETGSEADVSEVEDILLTLNQLLSKIGDSMTRQSVTAKRNRFHVVK